MTIIAWDGQKLVADTMGRTVEQRIQLTKIRRVRKAGPQGLPSIIGLTGSLPQGFNLRDWYINGKPDLDLHYFNDTSMVVVDKYGLWVWSSDYPMYHGFNPMAVGSGDMTAIGAMKAMKVPCARKAVNIVTSFVVDCGAPITVLKWHGAREPLKSFKFGDRYPGMKGIVR